MLNRREALKTLLAGALLPSWHVLAPKRHLDLTQFCAAEPGIRYDMTKPFIQAGKLYATDAAICVRMPTQWDDEPQSEIRLPPVERIPWRFHSWPKVERATVLNAMDWCATCEGAGYLAFRECSECYGTGEGEDGWNECHLCNGAGKVGTTKCTTCHGTPYIPQPCLVHVQANGVDAFFARKYWDKIQAIGGVEVVVRESVPTDLSSPYELLGFRFDGGEGLLMGLDRNMMLSSIAEAKLRANA